MMLAMVIAAALSGLPGPPTDHGVAAAAPASVKLAIESFGYRGVSLDQGPLRLQCDSAREYYLRIPSDDLLKGFRLRRGLPAPGADLGGWYSADVFHVFGQILSGLARLHAVSGDPACRQKAEFLVEAWAQTIEPDGYFFYSRKPNAQHYIYDKMVGGLADLVRFCDSKVAADALARITAWADKNLDRSNAYAYSPTEWYTLSENLYRAYDATGDTRYRDFARVWHYTDYWDVFARKGDLFGDRGKGARTGAYHAYSHVNTLGGAAQAYLHTGDQHFLDTLIQAHDDLVANQCFPTGGFGPDEQFLPRKAWLRKADYSHNSFETQCGAFAVFKLCKYLMTITGDARYGDWIERLTWNGLAATIPMSADGQVFYYSDFNALGGTKQNYTAGWSCCTGTRPMGLADLHDLVYFHDDTNLYVNLFIPSTVTWDRPGGRLTVRQRTQFPEGDTTEFMTAMPQPALFSLKLRVPGWLAGPLGVAVNGEAIVANADAHGWAIVNRQWRDGDRVVIHLPMKVHAQPLDASSRSPTILMNGPVALAVRSPGKNPGALLASTELNDLLIPSPGEPLTYHSRSNPDVLVRPFYAFKQGEPYVVCIDPTRYSHRFAQFVGTSWRESESLRFNNEPGASLTFAFEGTGVRWIGFHFDDAGTALARIDDQPMAEVSQYAPERNTPFEWRKDGLPRGRHRLTLTILDRFINIAGFEVIP
jgi:DUF1680 family protein